MKKSAPFLRKWGIVGLVKYSRTQVVPSYKTKRGIFMTQRSCELQFAGGADVQLIEVRFSDAGTTTQRITVRGKTAGAFRNAGTFQWTSAVRGLCILFARAKMASISGEEITAGHIVGLRASLAASLDYAITKQPVWIRDMFGTDALGGALAQRLISRTNPNRKRPGPVILGLNERALAAADVSITWNGQRALSVDILKKLLLNLGDTEHAEVSKQLARGDLSKIAA